MANVTALETHMSDLARWTVPASDMFFWLELLHDFDSAALMPAPRGRGCLTFRTRRASPKSRAHTLRLSSASEPTDKIARGVAALASVFAAAAAAQVIERKETSY